MLSLHLIVAKVTHVHVHHLHAPAPPNARLCYVSNPPGYSGLSVPPFLLVRVPHTFLKFEHVRRFGVVVLLQMCNGVAVYSDRWRS